MIECYINDTRTNTDVYPECLLPFVLKELWIFPDTSVLVLLSKIFIERTGEIDKIQPSLCMS